jgi:hypothetical protein
MATVIYLTSPPFQMSVLFAFVAHPVPEMLEWLVRAAFLEFANVYRIHILWHSRATGVLGGEIRWDRIQYACSLDIVTWMTTPYATFQGRCIPGIQHVLLQIQMQ